MKRITAKELNQIYTMAALGFTKSEIVKETGRTHATVSKRVGQFEILVEEYNKHHIRKPKSLFSRIFGL